jgi:hypothetical protein
MCKKIARSVGRLVALELMRGDPVLNSYSFNGFDKNDFLNIKITLNTKSINKILELLKLHKFHEKQGQGNQCRTPRIKF